MSLHDLFHNEELVEQITLIPIEELGVDAAILFSDILVVYDMLSLPYTYGDGGPRVEEAPVRMKTPAVWDFQTRAIQRLRAQLSVPLIGFVGGPYTVASYGSIDHLEAIEEATLQYIQMQVRAGVQVLQIFDSFVAKASDEIFVRTLQFLRKVREQVDIPLVFYARNLGERIHHIPEGYVIGVDQTVPLSQVQRAVQGNLDATSLLDGTHLEKAKAILDEMRGRPDFVFNLGAGVLPATPLSAAQELVSFVKEYGSRAL